MGLRSCLPALLCAAACFSPKPPAGAVCPPSGDCPDGQRCVGNVCVAVTEPDASVGPGDGAPDAPIAAAWTLVQTKGSGSLQADESRTLGNLAATGAGNTIIVAVETDDEAIDTVTDNAGNNYMQVANSRATNLAEGFGVEVWVANDVTGGATSITATTGNTQEIYAVVAWEVAGLAKTDLIDDVGTRSNQGVSGMPTGAEVTTTQPGDFVVSVVIVGNMVNMVMGNEFTNDHLTLGNGWAHLASTAAPVASYSAQWNQPSDAPYCASSVAFRRAN